MPVNLQLRTIDFIMPGDFVYLKSGSSWDNAVVTNKKGKKRWMIGFSAFDYTPIRKKGYKPVLVTVMTPDLSNLVEFFRDLILIKIKKGDIL